MHATSASQADEIEQSHQGWRVWESAESGLWWAAVSRSLTRGEQARDAMPFLRAKTAELLIVLIESEDERLGR